MLPVELRALVEMSTKLLRQRSVYVIMLQESMPSCRRDMLGVIPVQGSSSVTPLRSGT